MFNRSMGFDLERDTVPIALSHTLGLGGRSSGKHAYLTDEKLDSARGDAIEFSGCSTRPV